MVTAHRSRLQFQGPPTHRLPHRTRQQPPPALYLLPDMTEQRNPVPSFPRNKLVTSTSSIRQHAALSHVRNWRDLALPTLNFLLSSWPYYSLLLSPQSPLETLTSVGCLVYARDWGYYCNQQAPIKIYPMAASDSLKSTTIYYPLRFLN